MQGGVTKTADKVVVITDRGRAEAFDPLPVDDFVLPFLQSTKTKPVSGILSQIIQFGSRGLANVLDLEENTITAQLAKDQGISEQEVHIKLFSPFLELPPLIGGGFAGSTFRKLASSTVETQLIRESNELLQARDLRTILETLAEFKRQTSDTGNKAVRRVQERIEGNAEILRIAMQEEF